MQNIVANVESINFALEAALDMQLGILPLPFPGMDSK